MKELDAWLRDRASGDRNIPLVEHALFAGQFRDYTYFRLRLFALRTVVSTLTHTARLTLLWAAFSREAFVQLLLFEAAVGLAGSFWWGALEPMRDHVRRLHRNGRTHLVRQFLERWLAAAMVVATVVIAAGAVWFALRPAPFDPAVFYGVTLFVRLALQIVTRTYHSGLYALRRIYRPSWAVVGVELALIAVVLAAWPFIGAWALPGGLMAASIVSAVLTWHFTRRGFVFFGVMPRWGSREALRGRWHVPWRELVAAGLAYAMVKLDAVLVFALFKGEPVAPGTIELFMLFFVMSPAIQAGVDWAQLFYFDLKRLDHAPLAPLLNQYRRYVGRVAWAMGIASWLLACMTGSIVYLRSLGSIYALLLPFFLSRSLAAAAQIQAFSARRYGTLLASASVWLVVFALISRVQDARVKLAIVSMASIAVAVVLTRVKPAHTVADRFVGVLEWLHLLSAMPGRVRVGSAIIRPTRRRTARRGDTARNNGGAERVFARRLARYLADGGAVTCLPEGRIAWFEPAADARLRSASMAVLSGGLVQRAYDAVEHPDGRAALRAAWNDQGLDAVFGRSGDVTSQLSISELEERFRQWFPDGCVIAPGAPSTTAADLPAAWRRLILRDANRFMARLEPSANSPVDVTALCLRGQLHRVFVVRRTNRMDVRRRWRGLIKRANLLAALGVVVE